MDFKTYRHTGIILLPIFAAGIVSASIDFNYPSEVPNLIKATPLFFHPHEHLELGQNFIPRINTAVSANTATAATSTTFTTTTT